MITKGIIRGLPSLNTNKYLVEIPIFVNAGKKKVSSIDASMVQATYCMSSGIKDNLVIGDVVFIGFELENISKPIILGKLFLNNEKDVNQATIDGTHLNILNSASLPTNTKIGDLSYQNILEMYQVLKNSGMLNVKEYKVSLTFGTVTIPICSIDQLPSTLPLTTINQMLNTQTWDNITAQDCCKLMFNFIKSIDGFVFEIPDFSCYIYYTESSDDNKNTYIDVTIGNSGYRMYVNFNGEYYTYSLPSGIYPKFVIR